MVLAVYMILHSFMLARALTPASVKKSHVFVGRRRGESHLNETPELCTHVFVVFIPSKLWGVEVKEITLKSHSIETSIKKT